MLGSVRFFCDAIVYFHIKISQCLLSSNNLLGFKMSKKTLTPITREGLPTQTSNQQVIMFVLFVFLDNDDHFELVIHMFEEAPWLMTNFKCPLSTKNKKKQKLIMCWLELGSLLVWMMYIKLMTIWFHYQQMFIPLMPTHWMPWNHLEASLWILKTLTIDMATFRCSKHEVEEYLNKFKPSKYLMVCYCKVLWWRVRKKRFFSPG